jgi:hypothetical protein
MSARMLIDLTEHVGAQADEYFLGLDPLASGGPVEWMGGGAMPVWLDVAREYTERWHHQQQIRDATRRPGLYAPRLFRPVLDTFVRGLPYTFRSVAAAEGVTVRLRVTGAVEKQWELVRARGNWELREDGLEEAGRAITAEVTLVSEEAWKIFTRGIRGAEALSLAKIAGDRTLGEKVLEMVSVIA